MPAELEMDALVAVDKLDKIGMEGVEKELRTRGIGGAATAALLELMAAAPDDTAAVIAWLNDRLAGSANGGRAVAELQEVLTLTQTGPAGAHICIDPYLARGLSYYTGPIYEIEFPTFSGSGGAGGRYDDLIGMFSNRSIPACGFSLGLERILLIMEERGLFPKELAGQPQVLITNFDKDTLAANVAMAHALRRAGLRVDLYPDLDNLGRQFKYAEDRNIPVALLLGETEMAVGAVTVKNLISGEQESVAQSDVADRLLKQLQ